MQDKISVKLAEISGLSRQVGTGPFPSFHLLEVYDIQSIQPSPEPDGVYNPRLTARLVLDFPGSGAYPPRSLKIDEYPNRRMEAWLERISSSASTLLRFGCFLSPPHSHQGIMGVQCLLADMGAVLGGHARFYFRSLCISNDILLDRTNDGISSRV